MEPLIQDLRYGFRMLTKNPGFTAIAVLTLALGIGANAAIFSVADAFLLKPLPFQALDRLVAILEVAPNQKGGDTSRVSPANFVDWKSQTRSFDQLSAYYGDRVNLARLEDPDKFRGFWLTQNFFETLGVRPVAGRTFTPDEEKPGHDQVVVLSQGLWERRFGSDPSLLGKAITLDEVSYTLVGIMPKSLDFPTTAEYWMPLAQDPKWHSIRSLHNLVVVGRLKDGISISQARAEMSAVAAQLGESYPLTNRGWGVRVMPLRIFLTGDLTHRYSLLLLGAVAFVLLIACANVANLHSVRASNRQKEVAVRAALGASRRRVIRQLLTESVLLSLVGAAFGLLFAEWGVKLILAHMPPELAKYLAGWNKINLDHRSLLFTLGIAVLAGIVSGVAPSFQSSRPNLNETLKEGSRTSSSGRSSHRVRNILAVAEIALASILLVGSGLMVKSFRALLDLNRGFDPQTVLTMSISRRQADYKDSAAIASFFTQVVERLRGTTGVLDAAVSTKIPYAGYDWPWGFSLEGSRARDAGELRAALNIIVSPDYFRTMRIPFLQGRGFTDQDADGTPSVVIVSESLAKRCWPNQTPLGRRIRIGLKPDEGPWVTVVGVVGDVNYNWSERDPRPTIYHPYTQLPMPQSFIVVRISGDSRQFIPAVRDQIAAVDRNQPISNIRTLDRVISNSILWIGYATVMMSVLGIVALILSAVGVFGVMSYLVTERTHEIGIRMALGATRSDILRMVVRRGLLLTVIGLGIGLPISVLLARLLSSLVFWVSTIDFITFGAVSLTLAVVASLACYLPALRATHVDPIVALRYE